MDKTNQKNDNKAHNISKILLELDAGKFDKAIMLSATYGLEEYIKIANKSGTVDCVGQMGKWGATTYDIAIFNAAEGGHFNCLETLIIMGATQLAAPFRVAARWGHKNCMKFLIGKNPVIDLNLALEAAAEGGHIDCIKLLIEYANLRSEFWWSYYQRSSLEYAFMNAAEAGHLECMKLLKAMGATDFARALEVATWRDRKQESVELLLKTYFDEALKKAKQHKQI